MCLRLIGLIIFHMVPCFYGVSRTYTYYIHRKDKEKLSAIAASSQLLSDYSLEFLIFRSIIFVQIDFARNTLHSRLKFETQSINIRYWKNSQFSQRKNPLVNVEKFHGYSVCIVCVLPV